MGIAALILGIIGFLVSFTIFQDLSIILSILALVIGIIALVKKKSKGMAIAAIVLAALGLVIVFTQDSPTDSLDETSKNLGGENTEKILKNDIDVKLGEFQVTTDEYGLSDTKLVVTVTNKNKEKASYDIKIEAVDADGKRIMEDSVYADSLAKGQTQDFEIFNFVDSEKIEAMKSATFKIVEVSKM